MCVCPLQLYMFLLYMYMFEYVHVCVCVRACVHVSSTCADIMSLLIVFVLLLFTHSFLSHSLPPSLFPSFPLSLSFPPSLSLFPSSYLSPLLPSRGNRSFMRYRTVIVSRNSSLVYYHTLSLLHSHHRRD